MDYKLQKLKRLKSIILFSFVLSFTNCQDVNESNDEVSSIQTVTSTEANFFLNVTTNNTFSKVPKIGVNKLELDKITHEELKGSDQFLTVIPFSTNNETQYERVLLTKINSEIKGVVFGMYPDHATEKGKFSGRIIINSLDGEFMCGYKAEKGIIISQLFKINLPDNTSRSAKGITNDNFNTQSIQLDEVVIMNRSHGILMVDAFLYDSIYGGGGSTPAGGGSSQSMSWDSGYESRQYTPSPVTDPCDKIKEQIANALFSSKKDELSKKTNQKVETGFSQSKNGPFTSLGVVNANTLNIPSNPDTIGYIHTHVDEFENGRFDREGNPLSDRPIKMFSPVDVGTFFVLVKNAKANNIPMSTVYGAMVSSSGTYELRFTGNPDNLLPIDWRGLNEVYKTYFKSDNAEVGFLKFLQDKANISGIELYKINKNGTTTKKTLDSNNKLVDINC